MEPAVWVAAVAALVLIAIFPRIPSRDHESGLRATALQVQRVQLLTPYETDPGWLLSWEPVAGVHHYELRLYDLELEEIHRSQGLGEPRFELDGPGADAGLWRVYAYGENDELIAVSAVGTLSGD